VSRAKAPSAVAVPASNPVVGRAGAGGSGGSWTTGAEDVTGNPNAEVPDAMIVWVPAARSVGNVTVVEKEPSGPTVTVARVTGEEWSTMVTVLPGSSPEPETTKERFWGVPCGVTLNAMPNSAGAGVTALDADEAGPVPTTLMAVTVKVYTVPSFNH